MQKPVILVDGASFLFRAFYALPELSNDQGQPTGAIYGVVNMLSRLIKDHTPEHMVVVFDPKGPNFRHALYSEYKANRSAMPDDLRSQIAPLHTLIQSLGLPIVCVDGYEADDVIGTLTRQLTAKEQAVLIATGDKDITQLINPSVEIIDTMKDKTFDSTYVMEKFGVPPELMIDYLALIGDTSDNIPGVKGVGPKTAAKWLNTYGSLDNLLKHTDELKGKVAEKLISEIDNIPLYKQLVTIDQHVPIEPDLSELALKAPDTEALRSQYTELGFSRLLANLADTHDPKTQATTTDNHRSQYQCITDLEAWDTLLKRLLSRKVIAIDCESTGLDTFNDQLVGLSFSDAKAEAWYLPVGHSGADKDQQLQFEQVLPGLEKLLSNPKIKKVGQNIKFDIKLLESAGLNVNGVYFDTLLAAYLLEGSQHGRLNLEALALRHLDIEALSYEDLTGKGVKQIGFDEVSITDATPYAAEDADLCWQLYERFKQQIEAKPTLKSLFYEQDMPLLLVLKDMEMAGILIDEDKLKAQSTELEKAIAKLEEEAHHLAGYSFNLGSPKQLQTLLYETLQLPVVKKTPKGQPSTAEDVLEELAHAYELPKLILQYRHLSKLKSTYVDKLPKMINAKTGRVHTHYQQAVTATGRLSSVDPNLQNIPVRTERGRAVRQAFVTTKSRQLIAADYSQIELRIMAHLSQDEGLLTAFANGEDIHRATAAEVFTVRQGKVSNEQRRSAKAINFGLIYGMSAFGLAKQLRIGRSEAQQYIERYFERYPGVARYMNRVKTQAQENGYVETHLGRRLYLPNLKSSNNRLVQGSLRAAINAPMQGTAAEIIKRAMISLQAALLAKDAPAKLLLQVHDELILEAERDAVGSIVDLTREHMENAADLSVKLEVSIGVGDNWDQAH